MKSIFAASALAAATAFAQPRAPDVASVLAGHVLTPEWQPVASGTVMVVSPFSQREARTEADGRFRVEAAPGTYELIVRAPGLMTQRSTIVLPRSGMTLPPIQLSGGSYLRLKVVGPSGHPIDWPTIVGESYDPGGNPIGDRSGVGSGPRADAEGATIIGPLPRGMFVAALDTPPFARVRLKHVRVRGQPMIDAGTLIARSGAVLHAELVDAAGDPVANHPVHLAEAVVPSAIRLLPLRTDARGRATFDRLGAGPYHLRTAGVAPCGGLYPPVIVRRIDIPLTRTVRRRIAIAGTMLIRVVSGGAPVRGQSVFVVPHTERPLPAVWLGRQGDGRPTRDSASADSSGAACLGISDAAGRATIPNVPPGAAQVSVRVGSSTITRTVNVPFDRREIVFDVPTGVVPLRVMDSRTRDPIAGATLVWSARGARVEARTSVTGEALLDAVPAGTGRLEVGAPQYRDLAMAASAPADVLREISLEPAPSRELFAHVATESGAAIAGAVVELSRFDRLGASRIATTDRRGTVRFVDPPAGPLRLVSSASGFVTRALEPVSPPQRPLLIVHRRGYRIQATVPSSPSEVTYAVRVADGAGQSVDALLDSASDRVAAAGSAISLGPLAPGVYVVVLRSGSEVRTMRARITSDDVQATFE